MARRLVLAVASLFLGVLVQAPDPHDLQHHQSTGPAGRLRVGLLAQGVFWKGLFRDVEIVTWGKRTTIIVCASYISL